MEYFGLINDSIYPFERIDRKRKTVRAILVNSKKEIALLHIKGIDKFGNRDHYETPGGGVENNEEFISALIREIKEEIGYSINNIKEIGHIDIQYNLLNRIDEGYFYYAEIAEYIGRDLNEYEKDLFKEIKWININDIDEIYCDYQVENVGKMIHKRDYKMIKKAKELGYFD